ncbi:MAG: hypothetical protein CMB20_004140 [Methanobacteriota archaeon]|nr:MAG: hypothetical protein CMB20_004140 [Euryarchaeota archaeon]|tara:strand:- start:808 stop:1842 length:1035 start_codon:yes stop_codon:yes gene_type:complete
MTNITPRNNGEIEMSDENVAPTEETQAPTEETPSTNSNVIDSSDKLRERFRLTGDEEILKHMKPSVFAFVPMYLLALLVLGAHWMFEIDWEGDGSTIATLMQALITFGKIGNFGFVFVMLGITWVNRMFNGATSGKWTTGFLLIVTFTPMVLSLDNILVYLGVIETDFIPIDEFYYLTFGIFWFVLFIAFTVFYQRSFHYAITNHRVIFTQHLFIPGDGRRILFDNINEIRTQRTFLGALLGYNTIICDTGSQLGIGEDSMAVSVGSAAPEIPATESTGAVGILKKMFAFVTYQRTRKVDLPDPKFSLYSINKWKETEQLLNEMHQRHSQSGILSELKDQIASE